MLPHSGGRGDGPPGSRDQQHDPVTLPDLAAPQNLNAKFLRDNNLFASPLLLPRANQRFPCIPNNLPRKKNFNTPIATKKPGREHSRVVKYNAIAILCIGREIAKHAILKRAFRAVDHQHPRAVAFGKWLLRNQFFRQFVIEIGNPHSSRLKEDVDPRHRNFVR